jgi:hypothetical protein
MSGSQMAGNATFTNSLTVGKGRLFFNLFVSDDNRTPVTGLKYFGNTPTMESTRTVTTLDHFDSDAGQKVKDDAIDIQAELGGKFTCDNITGNNMALFFGGTFVPITQVVGTTPLTEVIEVVGDTYYQIGVTPDMPQGLRGTGVITITSGGGTPTDVPNDGTMYNFDERTGLLYVMPAFGIDPVAWNLSYELAADTTQSTVTEAGVAIYGAMLFQANNPKGLQRDFFFPFVKISPDAAMPLKGDTWMTFSFAWEALKLNDLTDRCYITSRSSGPVGTS